MTLHTFLLHNHEQRAAFVRAKGVFLTVRTSGDYQMVLFAIDNFFAEVWYRRADQQVKMVRAFRSTALLAPYLEQMELAELMPS